LGPAVHTRTKPSAWIFINALADELTVEPETLVEVEMERRLIISRKR
jgi:hypothetical protein